MQTNAELAMEVANGFLGTLDFPKEDNEKLARAIKEALDSKDTLITELREEVKRLTCLVNPPYIIKQGEIKLADFQQFQEALTEIEQLREAVRVKDLALMSCRAEQHFEFCGNERPCTGHNVIDGALACGPKDRPKGNDE